MKIFFSFFLLFLTIKTSTSIVVIPFFAKYQLLNFTEFNATYFMKYVYSNLLLTDVELGEPPQKLQACLSGHTYSFEVHQYSSTSYGYDISKSSSYINVTHDKSMSITTAKETITLYNDLNMSNKVQIKNITILLSKKTTQDITLYDYAFIGVKVWNSDQSTFSNNLIKDICNLKSQYNFIKDYSWQLKNINNDNFDQWQIIIGEYPHEYDPKNFKKEQLEYTPSADTQQWSLYLREIKSANTILLINVEIPFKFDCIFLIAPKEYKDFIYKEFFLDYFEQNICFEKSFYTDIVYCKKQYFGQKAIEKFPKLEFYENHLNYTFEFTGNDLFFEKDGYYYFMIGFGISWNFGISFFKKYPLIFNHDTRAIYYYNENKNQEKNEGGNSFRIDEKVIIGIAVGVIFLIVGLIVGKYLLSNKRKKKANELDDDYDYNQQNEKEIKLNKEEKIINDD